MALIHEKLYRSDDLARVDFAEYIKSLVSHLFQTYHFGEQEINIQINVEKISLSIESAIPCGLIINELVSNCLKYAFPNCRNGEIHLNLYKDQDDEERQRHILIVSDNGAGLPKDLDITKTTSLGMQLVKNLTHQLGGQLEVINNKGVTFKIIF